MFYARTGYGDPGDSPTYTVLRYVSRSVEHDMHSVILRYVSRCWFFVGKSEKYGIKAECRFILWYLFMYLALSCENVKISSSPSAHLIFLHFHTQEPNTQTRIIRLTTFCYSTFFVVKAKLGLFYMLKREIWTFLGVHLWKSKIG